MAKYNFNPFIVAKIETGEAINNLVEILEVSNGAMVARGDLGAEFGVTKLPRIQKHIIHTANEMTKPVITATQMLTSMKENPFQAVEVLHDTIKDVEKDYPYFKRIS